MPTLKELSISGLGALVLGTIFCIIGSPIEVLISGALLIALGLIIFFGVVMYKINQSIFDWFDDVRGVSSIQEDKEEKKDRWDKYGRKR